MARYYTALGPFESREIAERARAGMTESDALRASVLRLRDRTGPSVAERLVLLEARVASLAHDNTDRCHDVNEHHERLAALEALIGEPVCVGCGGTVGQHHAPDGGGCSGWFPTVREHLARIETEHRAAVYRISDMERLPGGPLSDCPDCGSVYQPRCAKHGGDVASPPATTEPTPEQIEAYLRGSGNWERVTGGWIFGHAEIDGTPTFAQVCAVESRTTAEMRARILGASSGAADPDRLAKVATDDDLLDLFERSEYASGDTRAARRALYDLGREHGTQDRAARRARAEKAERETSPIAKIHERLVNDCVSAIQPYIRAGFGEGDLAGLVRCVVADWQKRGDEIATLREPTPGSMLLSPTEWEVMLANHTEARRDLETLRVSVAKLGTDANDILARWDESVIPRVVYVQGHRLAKAVATIVETLRQKPEGVQ